MEEELVFFNGVASGRSTTLQCMTPYPELYAQHKLASVGY